MSPVPASPAPNSSPGTRPARDLVGRAPPTSLLDACAPAAAYARRTRVRSWYGRSPGHLARARRADDGNRWVEHLYVRSQSRARGRDQHGESLARIDGDRKRIGIADVIAVVHGRHISGNAFIDPVSVHSLITGLPVHVCIHYVVEQQSIGEKPGTAPGRR